MRPSSILILSALVWFSTIVKGQVYSDAEQHQLDSLTGILESQPHDTAKASSLIKIASILGQSDWDTLQILSKKVMIMSEQGIEQYTDSAVVRSLKQSLASALSHLAYVYGFRGNADSALTYNERSLAIVESIGDTGRMPALYLNIGTIYYDIGDITRAMNWFSKSARLSEKQDDFQGMAYAYNNMGFVLQEQGDPASALPYFEKTRQICIQLDDRQGLAMAHDNIGHIQMELPDDTSAIGHYKKALELRKSLGNKESIASSLMNIGFVYERDGELQKAMEYLNRALALQKEIGDAQGEVMTSVEMAVVSLKQDNDKLDDAIRYAKRALNLATEIGDAYNISSAAGTLSDAYWKKGTYQKALEMYKLHITMRDSVLNAENRREIIRQQVQYEYDKKEALLAAEQEKKDAIAQEQLQRREVYLTTATIVTFLLGIISLILFFFYRNRTKANVALEKKNSEISFQKGIIEEKNKHITDSIQYAKNLQSAILPKEEMFTEYFEEHYILYKPKDIVSGDFYWMEEANGLVFLAAADCTGHGVPGAMVSMVGFQGLNKAVLEDGLRSPAAILQRLSDHVEDAFEKSGGTVKDGMDICLIVIDKKGKKMTYAGAHNALWVLSDQAEIPNAIIREEQDGYSMFELKADRRSIGGFFDAGPFTDKVFDLNSGDRLFLFSDGYADQFGGPNGKKMGSKRMRETVRQMALSNSISKLETTFLDWKGSEEQIDDVTVISVVV